jgi:hypothetical protein
VRTRFGASARDDAHAAVRDLARREGTGVDRIGYTDVMTGRHRSASAQVLPVLTEWSLRNGFDGAVWTDLPPRLEEATGVPFSVEAAYQYLGRLAGPTAARAREYIDRAPAEVDTPLRRLLRERGWP